MSTLYLFDSGSIFSFLSVVTRVVVVSAMSIGLINGLKAAESLKAAEPVGGTLAQSLAQEGVKSLAADALRLGDPMRGAAIFHASYLTLAHSAIKLAWSISRSYAAGTGGASSAAAGRSAIARSGPPRAISSR